MSKRLDQKVFSVLLQQYPQLNSSRISRRALLAASSLLAANLVACGSDGDDTTAIGSGVGTNTTTNNSTSTLTMNGGVVTTLAGSLIPGSADGTGTAASFWGPHGVAVDSSGNVYVADEFNNMIRKITSSGVVTTLAGSGTPAYADGTGTAASFNSPVGAATDRSGNVYVADSGNNMIRQIVVSTGVVTTLAGSLISGSADGTGTAASFDGPCGVAVDSNGNVYVADSYNIEVRMITSACVVSTLAGSSSTPGSVDGTGTAASFYVPIGVAVDSSGKVYVADVRNCEIRKIS